MTAHPPAESASTLVHWMGPLDASGSGFVHGGTVLKLCDEAAGLAAIRHCRMRVVTAALDRTTFLTPIRVGDLVSFKAAVNAAWTTSMEVGVRVEAEDPKTGERRHTNSAYLTMVAVDDEGHPLQVPPLEPGDATAQRREREAQLRRRNRLAERAVLVEERRAGA